MKKLFLGSVALVAFGLGTAFAAERPLPAPVAAPVAPAYYSWSGCYVGASAGYSGGHTSGITTTAASTSIGEGPGGSNAAVVGGQQLRGPFELSGFIGGGQLGCNWQWGAWVFGIEGDGSATNKSGQAGPAIATLASSAGPLAVNPDSIAELQERWLVTARGKLGWTVWDKTMVYVTGGGAWAKIDYSKWNTSNPIATGFQQSDTRTGWTVGVGAEYALGYGWSIKGEYLYVDFGDWTTATTCSVRGLGCPTNAGTTTSVQVNSFHDHVVRAGMNYKFW